MFDLLGASAIDLSLDFAQNNLEIWETIYVNLVRRNGEFWQAINYGCLIIFGCGIINLVLKFNSNSANFAQQTITREIVSLFVHPFFILIFLVPHGWVLLIIMNATKDVIIFAVYKLMSFDILLGISIKEAIISLHTNALINREVLQIFADCLSGSQSSLKQCFNDPQRISQVQDLANSLATLPNVHLLRGNLLSVVMSNFQQGLSFDTDKLQAILSQPGWSLNSSIWSLNIFIWDLYLSFLNGWQGSLVMLAIMSQIYLAMSIVPAWSNYFSTWLKKWFNHFEMFFKYTIITGLIALSILLLSQRSLPVGTVNTDLTFSTSLVVTPLFLWLTSVIGANKNSQLDRANPASGSNPASSFLTDSVMTGINQGRKVLR